MSLVKHHLKRSLQIKLVKKDVFKTLIIEIEFILNNRPITFIFDNKLNYPLKPIDFTLKKNINSYNILK